MDLTTYTLIIPIIGIVGILADYLPCSKKTA